MSSDQAFSAFSPLCPNGGWPMSCARQAVSTMSGSSPRRRASSRPIWATSSEWVSRLRAKSSPAVGLSTWVFAARRRSALECSSRARSRAKSLRLELCSSGSQRSSSCSPYPETLATTGIPFAFGQVDALGAGQLLGVEPVLRQGRLLRGSSATARTLGSHARVGHLRVECAEQVVELRERADHGEAGPQVAADRVALEIPGDMLADVPAGAFLAVEELHQQFGMPAEGAGDLAQAGLDRAGLRARVAERGREVAEEPRAPQAAAAGSVPVTVKMRKGIDSDHLTYL